MKVNGVQITEAQTKACVERMKVGPFVALDIEAAANSAGVTQAITAMRLADRVIQNQKKAGNIKYHRPLWVWCGGQPTAAGQPQK